MWSTRLKTCLLGNVRWIFHPGFNFMSTSHLAWAIYKKKNMPFGHHSLPFVWPVWPQAPGIYFLVLNDEARCDLMMFRTGVLSPPGAPGGPGIQTRAIAGSSPTATSSRPVPPASLGPPTGSMWMTASEEQQIITWITLLFKMGKSDWEQLTVIFNITKSKYKESPTPS